MPTEIGDEAFEFLLARGADIHAIHSVGLGASAGFGAQDIQDHVAEAANDAIVVQTGHFGQRRLDRLRQFFRLGVRVRFGIEPGMEQSGEKAGNLGIAGERLLHMVLAEREGGLAQDVSV